MTAYKLWNYAYWGVFILQTLSVPCFTVNRKTFISIVLAGHRMLFIFLPQSLRAI